MAITNEDVKRVWDLLGQAHASVGRVKNEVQMYGGANEELEPHEEHFLNVIRVKMDETDAVLNQASIFVKDFSVDHLGMSRE